MPSIIRFERVGISMQREEIIKACGTLAGKRQFEQALLAKIRSLGFVGEIIGKYYEAQTGVISEWGGCEIELMIECWEMAMRCQQTLAQTNDSSEKVM